jgi:hypothetical protein
VLNWLESCANRNYKSSMLVDGVFSEPGIVQLAADVHPLLAPYATMLTEGYDNWVAWMGPQGEAVGDKVALPFATDPVGSYNYRGPLWFTMYSGL